ncbi:hypothetical protein P7K49_012184 [Saguinus oedipus]|uniref:Uncharacterized protein n=1 Tax=Saguinus oedipus TaxID=9490 RepID=A0ABQ9VT16_SAGOE|nr:hypothetical protein P7K49_012184 [Saguinus oedipus]
MQTCPLAFLSHISQALGALLLLAASLNTQNEGSHLSAGERRARQDHGRGKRGGLRLGPDTTRPLIMTDSADPGPGHVELGCPRR